MMKKLLALTLAILLVAPLATVALAGTRVVPSIERKKEPIIFHDEEGGLDIYNDHDEKVDEVDWDKVIVTPISDVDDTPYEDVKKNLDDAYDELLNEEMEELCEELDDIIKQIDPNYDPDDFIIEDLFDITIIDEKGNTYDDIPGDHIDVDLDANLTDDDEVPYVIYRDDEGNWKVVPSEFVWKNEDNTLHVRLYDLGVVAFICLKGNYVVDEPEVISPQTGFDSVPYAAAAVSAIVLAVSAVALVCDRKKKKNV